MTLEQLQNWLREYAAEIFRFTGLEIEICSEDVLHKELEESWFRDPLWNEPGYQFGSLGHDGTGGLFAVWLGTRESIDSPIVFFGSEGGSGVLAPSPGAFAKALAHGPTVDEYPKGEEEPSRLVLEDNWRLSTHAPAAALEALARYRILTEDRFGELAAFEDLVRVRAAVQTEFRDWVTAVIDRVIERDARDERAATDNARLARRTKAIRYAAATADQLPRDFSSMKDGCTFGGNCAACGDQTTLRLTVFEQLRFGLCFRCYFSNSW